MVAPAYVVPLSVIVVVTGSILTGCSTPVAVQAPALTSQCEPILAAAPIRVLGELQRETAPSDAAALAWGDPPIVLVCGVDVAIAPDAQVLEVNGVAWVAQESADGTIFSTVESDPAVQIRVPATYRPEADVLTELNAAISAGTRASDMS
ncbi:MAG TPA: hypothetical protein VGP37_10565 [Candidatus Nanopelagicales bacterium]|nr:hypothetical protein [Candidatus Nanopelagicales bacterium]